MWKADHRRRTRTLGDGERLETRPTCQKCLCQFPEDGYWGPGSRTVPLPPVLEIQAMPSSTPSEIYSKNRDPYRNNVKAIPYYTIGLSRSTKPCSSCRSACTRQKTQVVLPSVQGPNKSSPPNQPKKSGLQGNSRTCLRSDRMASKNSATE